ncbi:FMN-binding protein [Paenibacillus sp.]|jgi:major membrane immunogen (membrane-anchored lipoprotein)|uniref:FMN-binding protein n=1 Tax=Paenibacillus sp. TaxID=58172 RepID=UPI002834A5DD|nr:FMN-binding protein [Paenibacillus sp.]MDR0269204.1 FMN-binding protein [Paenibacillus sp.]
MNKKWSILLSGALMAGLLAGCGSDKDADKTATDSTPAATETKDTAGTKSDSGSYKDGTYFAEGAMDEKSGWQPYVVLTVESGKITQANWNYVSAKGGPDKKAADKAGNYGMKAAGGSSEWYEQAEKTEQFLIEKQDPAAIEVKGDGTTDAISGVSVHVKEFTSLAEQALSAGPAAPGSFKDGSYHAEGELDAKSGWKSTVDITVANGKIINAYFSGVNEKGEDKQTVSKEGKYGMKAGGATAEWHEEAIKAQDYLIEKQDPAAITLKDDGTTDAISGVTIHIADYVTLAQKALDQAK